ncbi:transposase, IS605 OrfB family, partial [mine drainage metagenome]
MTCSDGAVIDGSVKIGELEKCKHRYQRKLDRQHRTGSPECFNSDGTHITGKCYWGIRSKRSKATQKRIQKTQARQAYIRHDIVHKESHRLATTKAMTVLEDLNVKGMGGKGYGKRGFNRALANATMSELKQQMSYKHEWYNSQLWIVDKWYASSKTCSGCNTVP